MTVTPWLNAALARFVSAKPGRLSLRWLLWHGAGQAGHSVQGFLLGFLFIYYNQVLELSGTLAGVGIAIATVADGLSDPVAGSWSDGYRSRWGRRHPFMFASVIPVGVFMVALFAPPEGLSQIGLCIWFTVCYALMRTALTFYNVPYLGLGAEVTQDYQERTRIPVYRAMIGAGAALLVAAIGWNLVFRSTEADPHPQLDGGNYLPFAPRLGAGDGGADGALRLENDGRDPAPA